MAGVSKKKKKRMLIILIGIILIVIIAMVIVLLFSDNEDEETETASLVSEEAREEMEEEATLEKLYDMTEQERITYYCASFFKLVDNEEYEEAYELLYDEYVENYFPTLSSFSVYMETYFPEDFSLDYSNIERLGDIYVLWVDLSDTLNGSYGHNFSLKVVIREDDFNDYVLSFSKDSAVEEEEEEE